MKIKCENCLKIFNFKTENLPDKAFSFHCTKCREKLWVTQEEIVDAKAKARRRHPKENAGKKRLASVDPAKLRKPVLKMVGLVSRLSGRSEQSWLFSLTKFAALFSIAALLGFIGVGGLAYFSLTGNNRISYAELEQSLYLKKDPTLSIQSAVPGVVLTDRVKNMIGSEYRETFVDWMNGLEGHQKADFVANLDQIIRQAQTKDPAHLRDYIDEYQKLKFSRSVQKPYAPYLIKIGIAVMLFTAIALLGLFCLILLQLSWLKAVIAPEPPATAAKPLPKRRSALRKRTA